jgi:hypothetical protein
VPAHFTPQLEERRASLPVDLAQIAAPVDRLHANPTDSSYGSGGALGGSGSGSGSGSGGSLHTSPMFGVGLGPYAPGGLMVPGTSTSSLSRTIYASHNTSGGVGVLGCMAAALLLHHTRRACHHAALLPLVLGVLHVCQALTAKRTITGNNVVIANIPLPPPPLPPSTFTLAGTSSTHHNRFHNDRRHSLSPRGSLGHIRPQLRSLYGDRFRAAVFF